MGPCTSQPTQGQLKLLIALQKLSQTELAGKIGVKQQSVSRWARGVNVPESYALRAALHRELGIAPDEWAVPPTRALLVRARWPQSSRRSGSRIPPATSPGGRR